MLDAAAEREALAIFDAALDQPDADRDTFVAMRCGSRSELARRVGQLLAADAAPGASVLAGSSAPLPAWAESPLPAPPPQVGVWQLEELIGCGGMGAVYRARRADGLFEQQVAVKFVRADATRNALLPLVDAERRLLARMSHPAIARILDAGSSEAGAPYLVMEFVDGLPLDRYVALHRPSWRERVRLMREVCAAVAHAHGLLVLHNDIKPANVLVTAQGQPKLIDFGVARLQAGGDTQLPQGMTRAYASPERLSGEAPTVADDVYSLGVMLRELLECAPRPVETAVPHGDPGSLAPDREIDAIAARATAARRDDRYPTVVALDEDLQRRLDERPVQAMPSEALYRARKLVQRRPWRVASGAAALVGLLMALAVTSVLYWRAEEARREAQTRFNQTREMARFMLFELDDQLEVVPGTTPARRAVVERGQRYIDALAATATGDQGLQREVAQALRRLAEVQGVPGRANLGERTAALANVRRAEATLQALWPREGAPDWSLRADVGHVRYVHSLFSGDNANDYPRQLELAREAEALLASALADAEREGAPAARLGELHTTLLGARLSQAFALRFLERHADAGRIQAAEEARIAALPQAVRETIDHDFHSGRAPMGLGDSLYYQGRLDAALDAYQRATAAFERGLQQRPNHRKLLNGVQVGLWSIAGTFGELKRHAEELDAIRRALLISERLLALDPLNREARHMQFVISDHLATSLSNNGLHAEALKIAEANLRQRRADADAAPDNGNLFRSSITNLRPMAAIHRAMGDRAGECRVLREALAGWAEFERRFGLPPADRSSDVEPLKARLAQARCTAG